jgi:hypothetical protein
MSAGPDLVQPWRGWYADIISSSSGDDKALIMRDDVDAGMNPVKYGMSQHGTIALEPRKDVDLSKQKVKPSKKP